ncbi:MAG: phosphatidylglycerol lysyltransferase domain-containing protein [Thermodesulfobacteriota bacterium]
MNLKPITPKDYPRLKRFFERQAYRLCEYSLPLIIVWSNDEYQPYGAIDDESLIIAAEFATQKENRHLILPISPVKEHTPEELCELAVKFGFESFWFVPEEYINTYGKKRINACFSVTEQKGFNDYVYRTDDLIALKGNKYAKKRNLIHQFERNYISNGHVKIEPMNPQVAPECIDFLEEWCEQNHCDADGELNLACEKQAALNAIEHIDRLGVKGLLLRLEDKVSAFGIASQLTANMGVLHFEKADANIKGLYQYFDNQCALQLLNRYEYINKESDMNMPGLAKAKKSYHPAMIIKSYVLTLK